MAREIVTKHDEEPTQELRWSCDGDKAPVLQRLWYVRKPGATYSQMDWRDIPSEFVGDGLKVTGNPAGINAVSTNVVEAPPKDVYQELELIRRRDNPLSGHPSWDLTDISTLLMYIAERVARVRRGTCRRDLFTIAILAIEAIEQLDKEKDK